MDLLNGSEWEYRLSGPGVRTSWRADPLDVCRDLPGLWTPFEHWPRTWRAYGPVFPATRDPRPCPIGSPEGSGGLPEALAVDGATVPGVEVDAGPEGELDLGAVFREAAPGASAWVFGVFELSTPSELTLHAGADWWMEWWVDGRPLGHTLDKGNRYKVGDHAHAYPAALETGRHVVGARVLGGSDGWRLRSEATIRSKGRFPEALRFTARRLFRVPDRRGIVSLTLRNAGDEPPLLNGRPLERPLSGMRHVDWAGIPPERAHGGINRLARRWTGPEVEGVLHTLTLRRFHRSGRLPDIRLPDALEGLRPEDIRLRSGPIVGWKGEREGTVTCRTNGRTALRLEFAAGTVDSPPGMIHTFPVRDLPPGGRTEYRLRCPAGEAFHTVHQDWIQWPDPGGDVVFGVVGDPSPKPERFGQVLAALAGRSPDVLLLLGDLTSHGREDAAWDADFFDRLPDSLRRIPLLAIRGNHDLGAPLFDRMLLAAREGPNWKVQMGPATFVGIDGELDWSPDGGNARRLDRALGESDTPFLFLLNHFPAWSSSGHGREEPDGTPVEAPVAASRHTILPLAARHRVTAMLHGHEHGYERSLLPGDVPAIICAGGGGRIYRPVEGRNPHARVNRPAHHYGLLRVSSRECRWEAVDLDGGVLDTHAWSAVVPESDPAPLETS